MGKLPNNNTHRVRARLFPTTESSQTRCAILRHVFFSSLHQKSTNDYRKMVSHVFIEFYGEGNPCIFVVKILVSLIVLSGECTVIVSKMYIFLYQNYEINWRLLKLNYLDKHERQDWIELIIIG